MLVKRNCGGDDRVCIIRHVDGRTTRQVDYIRRADSLADSNVVGGTVLGEMGAMVVPPVGGEVENLQVKPTAEDPSLQVPLTHPGVPPVRAGVEPLHRSERARQAPDNLDL